MNRKADTVFMGIVFGIMIFVAGTLFISFISDRVADLAGSTGLNCDDSTISDGVKGACLITELVVPYFIIIIVSLAGGLLIGKLI